jgi:hypothetical protein
MRLFISIILVFIIVQSSLIVQSKIVDKRPPVDKRTFSSPAVEKVIANITSLMKDEDLASLFNKYCIIYIIM